MVEGKKIGHVGDAQVLWGSAGWPGGSVVKRKTRIDLGGEMRKLGRVGGWGRVGGREMAAVSTRRREEGDAAALRSEGCFQVNKLYGGQNVWVVKEWWRRDLYCSFQRDLRCQDATLSPSRGSSV